MQQLKLEHLTKTSVDRWLKVQSHLKTYQEKLHLALEVSSFYQQADKVLLAMNSMVICTKAC